MQKFGLDSISNKRYSALEFEIVKEQASALGIAGRKLQQSIARYHSLIADGISPNDQERHIVEMSTNIRNLLLQREFVGFIHENVSWIKKNYTVPAEVWKKLGY